MYPIYACWTDDSFNDSASGFSTSDFGVGDLIQVSGFSNSDNNKTYSSSHRITAITSSKITVAGSNLVTESAMEASILTKERNTENKESADVVTPILDPPR